MPEDNIRKHPAVTVQLFGFPVLCAVGSSMDAMYEKSGPRINMGTRNKEDN
jgi:hypothetical protein